MFLLLLSVKISCDWGNLCSKFKGLSLLTHYETFVHIITINTTTTTKSASTPLRINETQPFKGSPFLIGLAAACFTCDIINLNDSCWLSVRFSVWLEVAGTTPHLSKTEDWSDFFLSFKWVKSVARKWDGGEHQLTLNPPTQWRTYEASSFLYYRWSLESPQQCFSASTQTHPLSDVSELTGPADWTQTPPVW